MPAYAQTVYLNYQQQPLNEILLDLNERYQVQVSINAGLSNQCLITIKKKFTSIDHALLALSEKCQLSMKKVGQVYVFHKKTIKKSITKIPTAKQQPKAIQYLYQGFIRETGSQEPLPFTSIRLLDRMMIADENGRFSFTSTHRIERVQINHLGYVMVDTLLNPKNEIAINLVAKNLKLKEVVVSGYRETHVTNIGKKAGHVKFNDIHNNLVPGNSNDLIFNNLRLLPGVMNAGESIDDYVIWGSYSGQNHLIFDGITLFNNRGINNDVERVNPFMIKNVELFKGGYNVPYGDRIGAVVLIDGKAGNRKEFEGNISLTNQMANVYLSIPLFDRTSSLQIAGRKSYYQSISLSKRPEKDEEFFEPIYDYSDLHIKFSSSLGTNDKLEVITLFSQDEYQSQFKSEIRRNLINDVTSLSTQSGGAINYFHTWTKGGLTSLTISHSQFTPEIKSNLVPIITPPSGVSAFNLYTWENSVLEQAIKLNHTFVANKNHQLQINAGFIRNETSLYATNKNKIRQDAEQRLDRLSLFIHDRISITDRFNIQLGLKADLPKNTQKAHLQPRITGKLELTDRWNMTFGWGIYKQFIAKNVVVDTLRNQTEIWQVMNGKTAPVLGSVHHVMGLNYLSNGFEMGLEAFYKTTDGIILYSISQQRFFFGDARSKGIDLYLNKSFGNHKAWLSYSLGKVEEKFSRSPLAKYSEAPQSQRHELKGALVLNPAPFHVTFTQTYGSGFPNNRLDRNNGDVSPYWRTDLAFQYKFQAKSLHFDMGFSLLNLFNHKNIRLNQSVNVPDGSVINTIGIPFTPTAYVSCQF